VNARIAAVSITVVFGLILQATVFRQLNFFGLGLVPDLVLILVVSYGLLKGPWYGAAIGLAAGLVGDLAAGGLIGIGALAKSITGFLAGLLEKTIFKDNLLVPALSLLAGTIIAETIFLVVNAALNQYFGGFFALMPRLLAMALYNAILAPPIYHQFYRLETRLGGDA
jgi:rod shape-determining protein MreD